VGVAHGASLSASNHFGNPAHGYAGLAASDFLQYKTQNNHVSTNSWGIDACADKSARAAISGCPFVAAAHSSPCGDAACGDWTAEQTSTSTCVDSSTWAWSENDNYKCSDYVSYPDDCGTDTDASGETAEVACPLSCGKCDSSGPGGSACLAVITSYCSSSWASHLDHGCKVREQRERERERERLPDCSEQLSAGSQVHL
jgi:hypothetical protein